MEFEPEDTRATRVGPIRVSGQLAQPVQVLASRRPVSGHLTLLNACCLLLALTGFVGQNSLAATPPIITTQPQNQNVAAGSSVTFGITITSDGPAGFEWWNDFGPLYPPQTGATLTLISVQPFEAGNYRVAVRNRAGTVMSDPATLAVASGPEENFLIARTSTGTGADPGGNIDVDSAGNTYVVGSFTGSATFGAFTLASEGGSDVFVVKSDRNGDVAWARRAGGALNDAGAGVAVDRMGNVNITGRFSGSASFGPVTLSSSGTSDAFVATLDRDGNMLWARQLGGPGAAKGWRIACDLAGNSVVAGSFSGTAMLGATTLTSGGGDDVFVAKFSANGTALWAKRFGGATADRATGVALDAAANIFVTGSFQGTASFGAVNLSAGGGTQTFVAKCDRAGEVQWVKRISGIDTAAGTTVLAEDDGTCDVTGTFSAPAMFGGIILSNFIAGDHFVARYDGAGNLLWAARVGGEGAMVGLQPSDEGVPSGFGTGALDWNGDTGGSADVLVAKLSQSGAAEWAKQAGTSLASFTLGLVMDGAGQRYLTGFFEDEDGVSSGGGYSLSKIALAKPAGPPPPFITTMPQGQNSVAGDTVVISVGASAATAINYQWRVNGADLPGATSASLTLNHVQAASIGSYSVILWNADGAVVSSDALLTVKLPPDTTAPTIAITAPAEGARLATAEATLQGAAGDNTAVARVEVQLGDGPVLNANGNASWTSALTLQPGTNTARARSVDTAGNVSAWTARTVVFAPVSALIVTISGQGRVTPNLGGQLVEIGASCSLTALPTPGHEFAGWSGGMNSDSPTIQFIMQSGLVLQANFGVSTNNPPDPATNALARRRANYNGLFHEADGLRPESAGFFSLATTVGGRFTAALTPGGRRFAISGRFDPSGWATNQITHSGTNVLTVVLELASTNGVDQARGTVLLGTTPAVLRAGRAAGGSPTNPVPWAGRYTMAVAGADDRSAPAGHGFGTALVDSRGRLTAGVTLGDGTRVTPASSMTDQGIWPFFARLPAGKGVVASWVTFANGPEDDFSGDLSWLFPPQSGSRFFPAGFANRTTIAGSRYVQPGGNTNRAVNVETGSLQFLGGNLVEPFSNDIFLTTNNRVVNLSSNRLALALTVKTGLFHGSAVEPLTGRAIPFKGVLLQKRGLGAGQFNGTNETGRVVLEGRGSQ